MLINYPIKYNNKLYAYYKVTEILKELKYLEITIRNQTHNFEECKSNLHSSNFCYYSVHSPRYPLNKSLGGPQNQSEGSGDERNLIIPGLELRYLSLPAPSHSLYRLHHL
jgi:hypothetical protein